MKRLLPNNLHFKQCAASWQAWGWGTLFHLHHSPNIVSYGNQTTKPQKTMQLICLSPKQWTVKFTETWRIAVKGKWSNPLPPVMPHKTIFTNLQNRYHWQKITKRREKEERFVIQKLHSIYIFSIQTSTLYDRPTIWPASNGSGPSVDAETSAWPHSGPVCMQRDLRLSPQHNPSQLNPVTRRPLITPVRQAKNNSRGLNLGRDKIKMSLWLWTCLQLSIFNHCNKNKQRCEADFKSGLPDLPFMSPLALFSIIQSHLIGIISALFSCFLFGYLACCVNHYNYSKSVVENVLEKLGEDESRRRRGGWLIAWRRCVNGWFCCCLGKYNKQTRGKRCLHSQTKSFFLVICLKYQQACSMTKGVKPWISW